MICKENDEKWEQRRYEIAKDICVATFPTSDLLLSDIAFDAVQMADELIKELKKNCDNE